MRWNTITTIIIISVLLVGNQLGRHVNLWYADGSVDGYTFCYDSAFIHYLPIDPVHRSPYLPYLPTYPISDRHRSGGSFVPFGF